MSVPLIAPCPLSLTLVLTNDSLSYTYVITNLFFELYLSFLMIILKLFEYNCISVFILFNAIISIAIALPLLLIDLLPDICIPHWYLHSTLLLHFCFAFLHCVCNAFLH